MTIVPHHAVNQQVGITTDRAGKVGVELGTQTVMAVVVLRVACLLHRTQQHHVEDIRIGFILDPLHEVLKGVLADRAGRTIDRQTKAGRIVDELLQLV